MSKIIFSMIISFLLTLNFAWGLNSTSQIILKNKEVPQGVFIKKNKVLVKKGFYFEKVSKSRVNILARKAGIGITGSFDCTCNGTSGGCDVIVTGSSVSCAKSSCNSSCYMIVTIPGNPVLQRQ
jgi:hypothetical protein